MPRDRSISRLSARAASETLASSASSASSPTSRTAVAASTAAMPSRRLSCSARRLSLTVADRMRARSSRSSNATAWNLVRTAGVTRPPRAAASISRAVRDSIESDVAAIGERAAASAGHYDERPSGAGLVEPQTPPLECQGTMATASCRTVPRTGGRNVPGKSACFFKRWAWRADLRGSTHPTTPSVPSGPGAAGYHDTGKSRRPTGPVLGYLHEDNTCGGT